MSDLQIQLYGGPWDGAWVFCMSPYVIIRVPTEVPQDMGVHLVDKLSMAEVAWRNGASGLDENIFTVPYKLNVLYTFTGPYYTYTPLQPFHKCPS